ncbi:GlxA family transcriptional regulator [Mesorhizobium sp. M7A.F.Ca.CA.001.09.2.1]|nr:GlxA family transcriptional regulator [Mesorhizobium sp. M2A.F.Ca.ET.043.02.1.1]RUU25495.1 GlxA family transcriptional regulator [Mesorhizobium sp. M6A.T.Ce.TU.016.01.1.1]RUY13218.1 GlxA family transcriptional regulator [Mesorhizobium sp. M2A.F.Ca.ET.040.01.1.1]RUY56436.1 GlxA family transcriptional regulator [Mesorhizobium sp. M7A.F.Ca.CA.001.13.2.1]RUY69779.1 GlxA family transcriptional regulator [Mesorhizobium sp. M7A.F.Ca.CA.001.13.1.1]RUY70011.1 GlxA family transcriptional regulator [M
MTVELRQGPGSPTNQASRLARDSAPLSVGFLLLHRFTLGAFANFVDVLRLAADDGDRSRPIRCQWRIISPDMSPILSSCGVAISPHERIGDLRRFDYLVVVGGVLEEETLLVDTRFDDHLRHAAEAGIPLVGLCTGSFVLRRAGLMNGYKCCVSWFHNSDFLRLFDGLQAVSDQIYVVDRDRLTCSGGASAAHLAAFLVERHLGKALAAKSLRIMMFNEAAKGETAQPTGRLEVVVRDEVLKRAVLLMQHHLEVPLTIARLAGKLKLSRRLIERRFRSELRTSPQAIYTQIRLDHARHLLQRTPKSISIIAVECGFCDGSHLSRVFRSYYHKTPQDFRSGNGVSALSQDIC